MILHVICLIRAWAQKLRLTTHWPCYHAAIHTLSHFINKLFQNRFAKCFVLNFSSLFFIFDWNVAFVWQYILDKAVLALFTVFDWLNQLRQSDNCKLFLLVNQFVIIWKLRFSWYCSEIWKYPVFEIIGDDCIRYDLICKFHFHNLIFTNPLHFLCCSYFNW